MRGDKEAACLKYVNDHIRDALFPKLGKEERVEFAKALNSAIPNSAASDFPDFIISNGFIEHFEINASRETSKGSVQRIEEAKFERNCLIDFSEIPRQNIANTSELYSIREEMDSPVYTREDFIRSFKKHFQKHIDSSHAYKKSNGFRIFLIENSGATFTVLHNGRYRGELYLPSFDHDLLSYMSSYAKDLTHIVYRAAQIIEVIALSKIPELQSSLEPGITFEPGRFLNNKVTLLFSI